MEIDYNKIEEACETRYDLFHRLLITLDTLFEIKEAYLVNDIAFLGCKCGELMEMSMEELLRHYRHLTSDTATLADLEKHE